MIKKILMGIRGSLLFGGGFMALLKGSGDLAQVIFEKPQTKKVSTPSTEVTVEHVTPPPVHKPPVQPATVGFLVV